MRYHYVSSVTTNPRMVSGPSALASVHIPTEALALRPAPLVLTEGELKAHVATLLSGRPVVSVPGVGAWRLGVRLACEWGARSAIVAFDADALTKLEVARCQRDLLVALSAEGITPRLWRWPIERGRGLDDVLLAAHRVFQVENA